MWTTLNFLVGNWRGTGFGQPGSGQYERTYEFILNQKFLHVRSKSTYPPQKQNPNGEVHEDWGFFSYDKGRKTFVYRQFHVEGFVNQYVVEHLSQGGTEIVFVSETIENIPTSWRAKETYQVISPDEFIETFELAEPGKDFKVYIKSHLRRQLL